MTTHPADIALGWSAERLPLGSHVCLYYADETSLRGTLAFLRVGLDAPGELCIIFADSNRHQQLLGWLGGEEGVDVGSHLASGKLVAIGGAPDTDALAGKIVAALDAGLAAGYTAIRLLGFIAWGSPGWPDDASLLRFEDAVNDVVATYPAVVICTYGVPMLSGEQLINGGLGTHPIVMIGDVAIRDSALYRFHRRITAGGMPPSAERA